MKAEVIKEGIVIEKNGQYWGVVYEGGGHGDGGTAYGYGPLEKATIHDPRYVLHAEDVTYQRSPYVRELRGGKLVKVRSTVTTETFDD